MTSRRTDKSPKPNAQRGSPGSAKGACPVMVIVADGSGRITSANEIATQSFGWKPEDIHGGVHLPQIIIPHDLDRFNQQIKQLPSISSAEYSVLLGNGTTFPATIQLSQLGGSGSQDAISCVIIRTDGQISPEEGSEPSETALHRSQSQLRLITDNMSDIISQVDAGNHFIYVSPSIRHSLGYNYRQLIGQPVFDFIFEEDRPRVRTVFERCISRVESGVTLEYRHLTKNDDYRWVESVITFLYSQNDTYLGAIIGMRDSTERKRTLRQLEISEAQFRSLTEGAKDAIMIKDRSLKYLYVNPMMAQLLGFKFEDIIGKTDRELIGERANSFEIADRDVLTGKIVEAEPTDRIRGVWRTVHTIKVPMQTKEGEIIGICGIARDVTERNQYELALRESEERFRSLVELLPVGVIAYCDGKIELANQAVVQMLHVESAFDLFGTNLFDYAHPDDHEVIRQRIQQVIDTRIPQPSLEIRFVRQDGSIFEAEVTTVPFTFQNKPAAQVVMVDITERKRAEEEHRKLEAQIRHTQKLESLGVLAGGIAHDFNNLLVGVLGNAGLALMELSLDSPARRSVEAIETAAIRASELTRQMLAYSGKGRFIVKPLNLSKIVEEISHLLEVSISKRVILSYHFAEHLPNIEGDATQIRQIIMNLITNASEAIGEDNGVVTITTGTCHADQAYLEATFTAYNLPEGEYVYLEVSDTGIGMDRDTLSRIFDPFFTTKFTGRGLGLAAVIGIVRGHGGTIKVDSEPGKGTSFRVLFPVTVHPIEEAAPHPIENSKEWEASGLVLVVDDEASVVSLAKQLLEIKGFKVVTAADGIEAVERFRERPGEYGFVLLDLTLPKLSGEEVFRAMRQIRPDIRIILSSGFNEQEVTARFSGEEISGFIQKPYRVQELMDGIRKIMQ